jgi:hypothetical protein
MQKLRSIHLYLGCLFAPMLLFFSISGIWQTYDFNYEHSRLLALMSTIHTSRNLKMGGLTSPLLRDFVLAMSASFLTTVILGVVMALKFGRSRKAALGCLIAGVLIPLAAVLARIYA